MWLKGRSCVQLAVDIQALYPIKKLFLSLSPKTKQDGRESLNEHYHSRVKGTETGLRQPLWRHLRNHQFGKTKRGRLCQCTSKYDVLAYRALHQWRPELCAVLRIRQQNPCDTVAKIDGFLWEGFYILGSDQNDESRALLHGRTNVCDTVANYNAP